MPAAVAQWQSAALKRLASGVRFPPAAQKQATLTKFINLL